MDQQLFKRLEILINKAYYTSTRYKTESTFGYMYHEKELTPAELGSLLRISDHFIQIDSQHYLIHFDHTKQNDAFKACQNLLFKLDNHFKDTKSCLAIDTYDTSRAPKIVLNRLTQILQETRKNSYTRIEDENILNEMH